MSTTVAYVTINGFALVILSLIYINIRYLQDKYLIRQKLFLALLGSIVLQLFLDTIVWVLDGKPGLPARNISITATAIGCALSTAPFILWCLFVTLQTQKFDTIKSAHIVLLVSPAVINLIFAVASPFTGVYFYYDQANVYHRGDLFFGMATLWTLYFAYATIYLIINREKIQKRHFFPLLCFLIPPAVSGLIQFRFYGISVLWASFAVSMQLIFMSMQNGHLSIDYLTGLFNRRQLDSYLDERRNAKKKNKMQVGIMLDLDYFKMINDDFGHVVGDSALVDAAKILKTSFHKTDVICRYGGDEFVIITERNTKEEIVSDVNTLNENTKKFNEKGNTPYQIEFSIGYDSFDFKTGSSPSEFLKHIDALMYLNKRRRYHDKTAGILHNGHNPNYQADRHNSAT